MKHTVFQKLLDLMFPPRCLKCGKPAGVGEALCPDCRKAMPKEPLRRLYSPEGSGAEGFRVTAPLVYEGGYRESIHRFKFRGKRALAEPLADLMAGAAPDPSGFDCVTWAPLSKNSRRARGYDQSELLAAAVARRLGLPLLPLLEKVRETDAQHSLDKARRRKNISGAYRASEDAAGKRVLLVDDIVTTGATLTECALALYRAGAVKAAGLCAADAQLKLDQPSI